MLFVVVVSAFTCCLKQTLAGRIVFVGGSCGTVELGGLFSPVVEAATAFFFAGARFAFVPPMSFVALGAFVVAAAAAAFLPPPLALPFALGAEPASS